MKIQRFEEYNSMDSMAFNFINSFDKILLESDGNNYKKVQKKVVDDLKLNTKLIATFGSGIGALYPIVDSLMRNLGISSIEITNESIVLLTISSVTIAYLEERKFKSSEEEALLTKDSQSMLEELKMMGIGNGLVKKMIKCLESMKNIFSIIGKHLGNVANGIIDMFAYTTLLIPIMNGILSIVGKYELNLETLPQNFLGLAMGIGTIITKHGIISILNKIKSKFPINQREVLDEIETPPSSIQNFSTFGKTDDPNLDLIKEQ
jgi:hypothetical protein